MSALTIECELAAIRERWLSDGSLTDFYRSHRSFDHIKASGKLYAERERFIQRANGEQRQQIKKLWQFHQAAKYGPALSTSWKRTRRATFFDFFQRLPSLLEPPPGFPPADLPKVSKVVTAILKAAQRDDGFWDDFPIANKFRKNRSRVNGFCAEYSWLMVGKQPVLTFGELHRILYWVEAKDLRREIGRIRKKYGRLAVPLKPGRPGRPKK